MRSPTNNWRQRRTEHLFMRKPFVARDIEMDNVFSLPKPCPLVVRVATNQIREDVNEELEYGEWHGSCI